MGTILLPCSSSSTSATPRPTSAPIATASCVEHWRFATVRDSTADELGAALRNLLELRGVGLADLDASIVSSHGAAAAARVGRRWPAATSATRCWSSGPGIKTGMAMRYDNPREIGADRLVNAVAAYDQRRRRRASWSTSAPRSPSTRSRPRASTSAASSCPGVEISMEALTERAARAAQDRPRARRAADRQVDGRRDPLRRRLRLRRRRSTAIVRRLRDELGDGDRDDRDGRPGRAHRPVHRGDRRDRRPAHADRATAAARAQRLSLRHAAGASEPVARSPTASCSRRWPGSATGSCACRPSATAPGWRSRRWSRASPSTTATRRRCASCCASTPTSAPAGRSRSSSSARTPTSCARRRRRSPSTAPTSSTSTWAARCPRSARPAPAPR